MPSYNLITEKWIPCIEKGQHCEYSLQEVLVKAPEITEIYNPSPLVTVALHRLLLAILHRNFGPRNLEEWKKLWQARKWSEKALNDYFVTWNHRFNLFDESRPFYQTLEMKNAKRHPILHLAMEISSGNNATLFDHSKDEEPDAISSAAAARYVLTTQAFAIGFGKSYPFYFSDSPLIRGMNTLAIGNNLFETLTLNMVIYNKFKPLPHIGEDLPIWERDQLPQPEKNGSPICGYLDYLTWQSRSIHLYPEEGFSSLRYCQLQQNLKLPDVDYFDPFKCYKKDEKRGWVPLNMREDRVIWRDSHTLFQTADPSTKRSEVLNLLARIEVERQDNTIRASNAYRLSIVGLATETGKAANILLWRHERLPLPLKYLEDENLVAALKQALDTAENIGNELRHSIWYLAKLLVAPETEKLNQQQKEDVQKLANHLSPSRPYWAELGISFPQLVTELAEDSTGDGQSIRYGDKTLPWWANRVGHAAEDAFRSVTDSLDRSARMLKATSQADIAFRTGLNHVLHKYEKQ